MKAITIQQPWATLVALGEKRFETRSWKTGHRGPLAIHAGQTVDKAACRQEPIATVLAKIGHTAETLPRGAIIATCELHDCLRVAGNEGDHALLGPAAVTVSGSEYHFGDYAAGRYAWELRDVQPIQPIAVKGRLSLWDWEPPSELPSPSDNQRSGGI